MNRPLTIAVVGLGKIGLPIAAQFASRGQKVIGIDTNSDVIAKVNAGCSHIGGEPFLSQRVAETVAKGLLRATRNAAQAVGEADVVLVAVPLMTGAEGAAV